MLIWVNFNHSGPFVGLSYRKYCILYYWPFSLPRHSYLHLLAAANHSIIGSKVNISLHKRALPTPPKAWSYSASAFLSRFLCYPFCGWYLASSAVLEYEVSNFRGKSLELVRWKLSDLGEKYHVGEFDARSAYCLNLSFVWLHQRVGSRMMALYSFTGPSYDSTLNSMKCS